MSFMMASSFGKSLSSSIQFPVTKYKLKNGMRIILNPNKQSSLVSYVFGIATGSRHERKGHTGISHMFEHLLFEGTKKYPDFDTIMAKNGIVGVNAGTNRDYTKYVGILPPDKLEFILDVESDRFVNLTLDQKTLDRERKIVQEERRLNIDNSPQGLFWKNFFEHTFVKHPYRQPIIGYSEDIANYTLNGIKEWYKTYYSPNNAVFVLSGNFSEEEAKKLIEKYFGPLKPQKIPEEKIVQEPIQQKATSDTLKKPVQLSTVRLAFKIGAGSTKDFIALDMASLLLGAGESSRLYKLLVRDKKLSPSVSARTFGFFQNGLFIISYQVDNQEEKDHDQKISQSLELVQKELDKFSTEPITPRELEKIKNIYFQGYIGGLKRASERANTLFFYETVFNDYKKLYQLVDLAESITPEFMQKVAQKYLKPQGRTHAILRNGAGNK